MAKNHSEPVNLSDLLVMTQVGDKAAAKQWLSDHLPSAAFENALLTEFSSAAYRGDITLIDLILPRIVATGKTKFKRPIDLGLAFAAQRGNLEMVETLVKVADANAFECEALREAIERNHIAIAKVLVPHTDLEKARKAWLKRSPANWDMVHCVATLAPLDVVQKWTNKYPAEMAPFVAEQRSRQAHEETPSTRTSRLRTRV